MVNRFPSFFSFLSFFLIYFVTFISSTPRTVIKFERKLNTCDLQDREIQNTTTKVLYAYNNQDPINNIPTYHQERGIKSVRFFSPTGSEENIPPPPLEADGFLDSIAVDTTVHFNHTGYGPDTAYWISFHKFNVTSILEGLGEDGGGKSASNISKIHIIRIDPVLDERNYERIHHIDMYHCVNGIPDDLLNWTGYDTELDNVTYLNSCFMDGPWINAWSIGGGVFLYPDHVGLPFEDVVYVLMLVHYNNPPTNWVPELTDSSGMRFWYTKTLREYDAGLASVAFLGQYGVIIPPQIPSFPLQTYCPGACTEEEGNFPPTGVNIIAAAFHTHLLGDAGNFTLLRNGTEIPILLEKYYDFNYQDYTMFNDPEFHIMPGDEFQITCDYNSMSRTNNTYFGPATVDEMCMVFIIYYPRTPVSWGCGGYPSDPAADLGNQTIYCGANVTMQHVTLPSFTPYTPPPCSYSPPPSDSLIPQYFDPAKGNTNWSSQYQRSTIMDSDTYKRYRLYWNISADTGLLQGLVEVEQSTGWVGFGISEHGMDGADVFIAWVQTDSTTGEKKAVLNDRFAVSKSLPPLDLLQDLYHVSIGIYDPDTTPVHDDADTSFWRSTAGIAAASVIVVVVLGSLLFALRCYRSRHSSPTQSTTYYVLEGKTDVPL